MLVERYESIKGKGISTGEELGHPLAERPRQLLMLVMKIGVLKPSDRILHVTLDVQELIDTGQRSESITVNGAKVGKLAEFSASLCHRQLVHRVRGTHDTDNTRDDASRLDLVLRHCRKLGVLDNTNTGGGLTRGPSPTTDLLLGHSLQPLTSISLGRMIAGGEVDGGHAVAMDDEWVGAKERERERERE